MINVAVCGATGYTGAEIIRILLRHPKVRIKALTAKIDKPCKLSDVFAEFKGSLDMQISDQLVVDDIVRKGVDLIFLALPHRVSVEYATKFIDKGKIVIDLSADFRLKDAAVYEKYYGHKHMHRRYLSMSVYGLPELYIKKIKNTRLIANPGCYPTASILGIAPLLAKGLIETGSIIIDAKTGVSGAGRKADIALHFAEVTDNIKAYKIGVHQHAPEIEQELSNVAGKAVKVVFTPHLIPMNRGILSTIYVRLSKSRKISDLLGVYKSFYKKAPFVKVYEEGRLPEVKDILGTNYCAIGMGMSIDKKTAVIVSVIDNLGKGAGGQAVQNMNIVCGFPETMGLI